MATYKIVVVGVSGVGKTALTIQLVSNHFIEDQYDPTVEESYRKRCSIDDEPFMLEILDTADVEGNPAMREQYMRTSEGFLIVYSVTNRNSFLEVSSFHDQILRVKDVDSIPMVLAGNKIDLTDERKVPVPEGKELATQWQIPFFETSAKDRINVEEAFFEIIRKIRTAGPHPPQARPKNQTRCFVM